MSATEKLLILCTLQPLNTETTTQIQLIAKGPIDWRLFLDLARLNKVEPKVTSALRATATLEFVPSNVQEKLIAAAEAIRKTNVLRAARARELFERLNQEGIPVCVLKGMLFSSILYEDVGYKRMNDVDMLFKKADLPRLPKIYTDLGYFPIGERVSKNADAQTKVSHHLPPYVSRTLDCVLGTQWGLKSPLLGFKIDYAAIWKRSLPFDYNGVTVRQMAPTDNLFHVCIHLGFFKTGLRDLMDIYNLANHPDLKIDYALFTQLIDHSGAYDVVYHSLSLANAVCPNLNFTATLNHIRPRVSRSLRKAVTRKTYSTHNLLQLCSGYLSEIEKSITDYNASEHPIEKASEFVHFWKLIFFPNAREARRLCLIPEPNRLQRALIPVLAPFSILSAMAKEIGGLLLIGLVIKATADLCMALFNPFAWIKRDTQNLEHFVKQHGITIDDYERVKSAIF